jgi:hypothetical protein
MSKVLSLKLRDEVYEETESITHKIHVPRNAYINRAVDFYNKLKKRALLKKQLAVESKLVRDNSLEVLETFEALEDEIEGL